MLLGQLNRRSVSGTVLEIPGQLASMIVGGSVLYSNNTAVFNRTLTK